VHEQTDGDDREQAPQEADDRETPAGDGTGVGQAVRGGSGRAATDGERRNENAEQEQGHREYDPGREDTTLGATGRALDRRPGRGGHRRRHREPHGLRPVGRRR